MIRAVLFDLDGTLADTLEDILGAMNATLAGIPGAKRLPAPEDYRRMIGDGATNLTRRALALSFGAEPAEALVAETVGCFRRLYRERLIVATAPYPGIPELLDELTARRVPLAVLSNKPHDATREIIDRLFSRWPWVAVQGETAGTPRKPDPAAPLAIAAAAGIPPADWALVGDGPADMAAARAAGMRAVAATWGFRTRAELEGAGAQAVIERPSDLLALLPTAPRRAEPG